MPNSSLSFSCLLMIVQLTNFICCTHWKHKNSLVSLHRSNCLLFCPFSSCNLLPLCPMHTDTDSGDFGWRNNNFLVIFAHSVADCWVISCMWLCRYAHNVSSKNFGQGHRMGNVYYVYERWKQKFHPFPSLYFHFIIHSYSLLLGLWMQLVSGLYIVNMYSIVYS